MADENPIARSIRVRREPPPLRPVAVVSRSERSPRLLRLTVEGDGLRDLVVDQAAASIRLLVPTPGTRGLVIPRWNGNEFRLPDDSRPTLRTFTPLRVDNTAGRLDIEIVRHPGGAVSGWAETATPGDAAAISGPGSGYAFPAGERLVVLADETALPAVTQLIAMAPAPLSLDIHVEVVHPDAEIDLPLRRQDSIEWLVTEAGVVPGGRIVEVARSIASPTVGTYVWAAGEASAMHAIRTHLFDTLDLPRSRATVRGYWKPASR